MNILLIGSGGREHALAWKIRSSPLCTHLWIAPGNAGTASLGNNIDIAVNDFEAIGQLCKDEHMEMVIVGPEEPLVLGIYDYFENDPHLQSIKVIGPSGAAARLEGSKAFSKHFMEKLHIPTAGYAEFDEYSYEEGKVYISQQTLPIVLKADGLAAGKGVVIAQTHHEALEVFEEMIVNRQFGEASARVVIETFLEGIELSVFVLTDGQDYKIIGHAKDYKRIGEADTGLNTGGMGCISPVPFADNEFMAKVEDRIIKPTIKGLQKEALTYKGFIFFGLINTNGEPFVIEYNCRMGDPETEVVLPRLKNDLVQLFLDVHSGQIGKAVIEFDPQTVATVMAVSGGYPGAYKKGIPISGLNGPFAADVMVFHAGTTHANNQVVTNGGRVLAVSAFGENIAAACTKSKQALGSIFFDGIYFRKDIGFEFE